MAANHNPKQNGQNHEETRSKPETQNLNNPKQTLNKLLGWSVFMGSLRTAARGRGFMAAALLAVLAVADVRQVAFLTSITPKSIARLEFAAFHG